MKWMSTLFAALMLCLTVIPCDDVKGAADPETEMHSHDSHEHGEHSDTEGCSPFCVCNCCQTHIVFSIYNFQALLAINIQSKPDFYSNFHPRSILYAIWRPPQQFV